MIDTYPLITTIVSSVVFAFLMGFLANKIKLPTIVGYLFAGMLLGPHTPGFVANINLAKQLAEIGIILLMFGVGLHFSIKDLMLVNRIALPGSILQIAFATLFGIISIKLAGYSLVEAVVFGLAISVASTIVLLRLLEQHHLLNSKVGKIAIGWLVVEDIAMIISILLMTIFIDVEVHDKVLDFSAIVNEIFIAVVKIIALIITMVVLARRLLPKLLVVIAKSKSKELMSLGTLSIAMGFSFLAYTLFGASFALGAFLAGMVLNESAIGRKAAHQSLPLRDMFAVLFFISVGMLFNPLVLIKQPFMVLVTLFLIVIGKPFVAYLVSRFFHQSVNNSLMIAVSLAQVGEFSFILAGLALNSGVISNDLYDLILAGALLSIAVNPLLFKLVFDKNHSKKPH
ncbi:MAG: ybaL [Rickettsiaceae bacterium]|jgi:CPA2 family monovalent cation:H+ antiporter-2|nr:ybaL [Rickettsiaceae bacterium]